jgi:hypothetical protein
MRIVKTTGAVVLLFAVLIVFAAPAVDLDPSALRASRAAALALLSLALSASIVFAAVLHQTSARLVPSLTVSPAEDCSASLRC